MDIVRIAELCSLHLSETEERALTIIFLDIIIEIRLEGEPLNSSIENLKNISSLNDGMISSIVSFLKSLDDETQEEYILKGVLDIMRGEVKIDYTYLTEPLVTPTKTETVVDSVDLTKFASLPPQPYPSWIISDDLTTWEPPVKYPDPLGIGEGFNVIYTWNEETKQFENILPETPQPFPSWSAGYIAEQLSIGWIPPKPYPDGTGKGYNKSYRWNEDMLTWQDILV